MNWGNELTAGLDLAHDDEALVEEAGVHLVVGHCGGWDAATGLINHDLRQLYVLRLVGQQRTAPLEVAFDSIDAALSELRYFGDAAR